MQLVLSSRMWALAACLVLFDIVMLAALVSKPLDTSRIDRSRWDFRIHELRQLETASGEYDASRLHAKSAPQRQRVEDWLDIYFPGRAMMVTTHPELLGIPRQANGLVPVVPAPTSPADSRGQVL